MLYGGGAGKALTTKELCKGGGGADRQETRHRGTSVSAPGARPAQAARSDRAVSGRLRCSVHTEQGYRDGVGRFMLFHGKRHPDERRPMEGETFLTPITFKGNVASSAQNHAPNAIVFLYGRYRESDSAGWRVWSAPRSRPDDRSPSRARKS